MSHSLVPRLLTLLRGWGLGMRLCEPQYEGYVSHKTEGEGLGERVTCVTSGRREGRHRGGRCLTKNLEVLPVIFCPRT